MTLQPMYPVVVGGGTTTLDSSYIPGSSTTISVVDAAGFPNAPNYITLVSNDNMYCVTVKYESKSENTLGTLTVIEYSAGGITHTYNSGDTAIRSVCKADIDAITENITAINTGKVDVSQGVSESGKLLGVDSSGNVTTVDSPISAVWGNITGTLSNQTDLQSALDNKEDEITINNKLSSSLVNDANSTNKFTTDEEKATWNSKVGNVTLNGTSVVSSGTAVLTTVDNVTSTNQLPLSANQGKLLNDRINNLETIGRFLSLWNCATGLPTTDPTTSSYTYKTGDYYIITVVDATTNYKPEGSTYTSGVASTTVTTDDVQTGDIWRYDGSVWSFEQNHSSSSGVSDVTVNGTSVVSAGVAVIPAASSTNTGVLTSTDWATFNGKQPLIDSSNKLSADLVDDTSATNKFVTSSEKTTWTGKQNAITSASKLSADLTADGTTNKVYTSAEQTKLAGIESGAQVNVKPDWNATAGTSAEILNKPSTEVWTFTLTGGTTVTKNVYVGGS